MKECDIKPLPKWDVWKHVPILNATEAVSLTLNIEPHTVYEWSKGKWVYNIGKKSGMCTSIAGFADRLFLFKKCFGIQGKISLIQLAIWSQSVGWNIPIELAALAPVEPKEAPENLSTETILKALAEIVPKNGSIDALYNELIRLNVKFIMCEGVEMVLIPDGTVNGKRSSLSRLYSVVSSLCLSEDKLSSLVRGSGASGGGARNGNGGLSSPVTKHETIIPKEKPHVASSVTKTTLRPVSAKDDTDNEEKLISLFDPVPIEALETMFPAKGKWKGWAEHAKSNGLSNARVSRAKFNPYKAGMWFVQKGEQGWDVDRLYRVLANKLPLRSRENAYLFTLGID